MAGWTCLVVVVVTVTAVSGASCPGSLTATGCYVLRADRKSWAAARASCRTLGASLGRPGFGTLTSLQDRAQSDRVEQVVVDTLRAQQTYAAEDALRVTWVGGSEEGPARGDAPSPLWRWLSDETRPLQQQNCFADSAAGPGRDFPAHRRVFAALTPQVCRDHCHTQGYPVAATTRGDTCSCGNRTSYGRRGTSSGCTMQCTSGSGTCGGTDCNQVYIINGSLSEWTSNQPNNYNDYQLCGHIERYAGSVLDYTLGDKFCRESHASICRVPKSMCLSNTASAYLTGDVCIYYEVQQKKNWFEARAGCRALGGDLISADSPGVLSAITDTLTNTLTAVSRRAPLWVGAFGAKWTWDDGAEFLFTKFSSSHPISKDYNCLQLHCNRQHQFEWRDADCATQLPYICYIDMVTPLPTTTTTTMTTTTTTTAAMTTSTSQLAPHSATSATLAIDNTSSVSGGVPAPATSQPGVGASSDTSRGPGSMTYILLGVIVGIMLLIAVAGGIFWYCKKKQRKSSNFIHPDENGHSQYEQADSADTHSARDLDEASAITTSNINADVALFPSVSQLKVYERRFKLDPIVPGNGHRLTDLHEDFAKREKKDKRRKEREEREEKGEKRHRKKKKSKKELSDQVALPPALDADPDEPGTGNFLY